MHPLTAPDTHDDATLHQLDRILHSLWAHEPDVRFGERHHRLNTLRQLMIEVERLQFRQSFHLDEHIERSVVDDCVARAASLADRWSDELWISTPWPSDILGPRPSLYAA